MNHSSSPAGINSRYSKPTEDILFRVEDYLSSNLIQKENRLQINARYAEQPIRTNCKVCEQLIVESPWFESFGIRYFMCKSCGHLNGQFDETPAFTNSLYSDSRTSTYDTNYDTNYELRVKNIYIPKLDFLLDSLKIDSKNIRLLDFGCGAGHFVKAAQLRGVRAIGLETNEELVKIGQENVGINDVMQSQSLKDFETAIEGFKPDIISFVGVLEHLSDMNEVLDICKTHQVRYIYSSVPIFSLTSLVQTLNEGVFPRQLSGGHTHLFTDHSLKTLLKNHQYIVTNDWWFGTDIADLSRTLAVSLDGKSYRIDEIIQTVLSPAMNRLQEVLDQFRLTSEVHALAELS